MVDVKMEEGVTGCKYPCLKTTTDDDGTPFVVYFTGKNMGFVVTEGSHWDIFKHGTRWAEEDFETYTGKVIFQNT